MRCSIRSIFFVVAVAAAANLSAAEPGQATAPRSSAPTQPASPQFDKVGPQVGDQLPDLALNTIKGEPQRARRRLAKRTGADYH